MNDHVVVGGSSGIGLCLCQKLIESGASVTCISRSACPIAKVTSIVCDVRDEEKLKQAFDGLEKIDALIYCAGISLAAPCDSVEPSDVEDLIEINLTGAMLCVRYAMPLLNKSEKARIMLLSSTGGVVPIAYDAFYSASKAGLIAYSRALELELNDNVRCTAALIGGTRTRFSFKRKVYDENDEHMKNAAAALIDMEQNGYSAEEVADKILELMNKDDPPPVASIGKKNALMIALYRLMPRRLKLFAVKKIYRI